MKINTRNLSNTKSEKKLNAIFPLLGSCFFFGGFNSIAVFVLWEDEEGFLFGIREGLWSLIGHNMHCSL